MRDYTPTSHKAPVTWILVADGHHAQVYARSPGEKSIPSDDTAAHPHFSEATEALAAVPGMGWKAESSAIYDAGSKNPGKVHESMGLIRHGTEPHLTIGDEIKQHFTTRVADEINRAHAKKTFDKLVLVAPAKMLGDLRSQLDKAVLPHVLAQLSKDLTRCSPRELVEHLKDIA